MNKQEETYRQVFEVLPDPAILWRRHPDGKITMDQINAAAIEMSKGKIVDFLNETVETFFAPDREIVERIRNVFETGEKTRVEMPYQLRTTGDDRWIVADYVKIDKDYLLNIIRDITQSKKTELNIQRSNRELIARNAITAAVSQSLDLKEILHAALSEMSTVLDVEGGAAFLLEGDGQTLWLATNLEMSSNLRDDITSIKVGRSASGRVAASGHPLIISDLFDAPEDFPTKAIQEGWRSYAGVPITAKGNVLGVLALTTRKPGYFTDDHLNLLRQIGYIVGVAVENATLYQQAQDEIAEKKRIETALRESEEIYQTLVENLLEGLAILQNGRIVFVNPALVEMSGYTREEWLSLEPSLETIQKYIHPEDQATAMKAIANRMVGHPSPERLVIRLIRKDGATRWVEASYNIIPYRGQPAIQAAYMDITNRKLVEEELRYEMDRAQQYLDIAGVMMLALDQDGDITLINQKGCEILGCTKDAALGNNWFETFIPEENRSRVKAIFRSLMSGQIEGFEDVKGVVLTQSGEEKHISWSNTLLRDEDGNCIGTLSSGEDITERVQAERERTTLLDEVRRQAQRLVQIMETVPEGVLLLESDQKITLANPLAEKTLQYLSGVQPGERLTHLGNRSLDEILTSPPKGLWHEVSKNGHTFQVIARPIESDLLDSGWVLVIRDVTQQRNMEARAQQQDRLAAIGQLAAGIAHDFNNIMATIALYAQMVARSEGLTSRDRDRVVTINQQALYATDLIQQILDFSRRAVLERQSMDLVPFLTEQVRLLKRTLTENIEVELVYGRDDYTINADPTRMQQSIMNLAFNARDVMPSGGTLRIEVERLQVENRKYAPLPEMEPGEWIHMAITDTGTGIPDDVLPHIFDPFFTTKERGEGTGLGLSQVYGIIKHHEGHVDVITHVGEGTTFSLYLPALPIPEPQTPASEKQPLPRGAQEVILVVEDNAAARKALLDGLTLLDYEVLEARNGAEGLEVFEQNIDRIDLVLSDLVMPEMGGQALFHTLCESYPDVCMVLMTGHPMTGELERLREQGLRGWLLKPLDLDKLAHMVARALKDRAKEA